MVSGWVRKRTINILWQHREVVHKENKLVISGVGSVVAVDDYREAFGHAY